MKNETTTKTPEQIMMMIRDMAIYMLAPVKDQIDHNFKDADYRRIMWLVIIEQAKRFADAKN